jgi:hypothetical protein
VAAQPGSDGDFKRTEVATCGVWGVRPPAELQRDNPSRIDDDFRITRTHRAIAVSVITMS